MGESLKVSYIFTTYTHGQARRGDAGGETLKILRQLPKLVGVFHVITHHKRNRQQGEGSKGDARKRHKHQTEEKKHPFGQRFCPKFGIIIN